MTPQTALLISTGILVIAAALSVRTVRHGGLPWGHMAIILLVTANALAWPVATVLLRPGIQSVALILTANTISLVATAFMHREKDTAQEAALRKARTEHYLSPTRIRREERRRGL